MGFNEDLAHGQAFEKLIPTLVDNEGCTFCNNKDYDVELIEDGVKVYYEVKADRMTYKTGNICIEYECFGKPSGITTTKADWYAYFEIRGHKFCLYMIPVKALRSRIRKHKYFKTISGGDNNASKCYLFKKQDLEKFIYHFG